MRRFLFLVGLLIPGCVVLQPVTANRDTLQSRASFDMQCPTTQLRITEIDASTAGVEGCGQRGTYIYNQAAGAWVLNSPGATQPMFEPPPASSERPGVPAGSPPGTLPGSLPGTPPGTLPGAPIGSPPGTPPGGSPH